MSKQHGSCGARAVEGATARFPRPKGRILGHDFRSHWLRWVWADLNSGDPSRVRSAGRALASSVTAEDVRNISEGK